MYLNYFFQKKKKKIQNNFYLPIAVKMTPEVRSSGNFKVAREFWL